MRILQWVTAVERQKYESGVPSGIRTRVLALKGPRPGPLDDGDNDTGERSRLAPEHLIITAPDRFTKPHLPRARSVTPSPVAECIPKPLADATQAHPALLGEAPLGFCEGLSGEKRRPAILNLSSSRRSRGRRTRDSGECPRTRRVGKVTLLRMAGFDVRRIGFAWCCSARVKR